MKNNEETEKVELTEQGKRNVRINLQDLEIQKSEHELHKQMSTYLIDNQISNKIVSNRISEIKGFIETKKNFNGKVIPESRVIELQATLKQLEIELKLDLPMKRERSKLASYMNQEQTMNAIDNEIKDLKKSLRTGFIEVPKKKEVKEDSKK